MSLETDLLYRMFKDDLQMADQLLTIGDFAMAAESLAGAIEKIHQICAASRAAASHAAEGAIENSWGLRPHKHFPESRRDD